MRYYSDVLDEMFDTQKELEIAEKEYIKVLNAKKESESLKKIEIEKLYTERDALIDRMKAISAEGMKKVDFLKKKLDDTIDEYLEKLTELSNEGIELCDKIDELEGNDDGDEVDEIKSYKFKFNPKTNLFENIDPKGFTLADAIKSIFGSDDE